MQAVKVGYIAGDTGRLQGCEGRTHHRERQVQKWRKESEGREEQEEQAGNGRSRIELKEASFS